VKSSKFIVFLFILSCGGGEEITKEQGGLIPQEQNIIPSMGCIDESKSASQNDDPLLDCAWYLNNTGQTTYNNFNGIEGKDINLDILEEEFKGSGIEIVVSDTRIDLSHEDLRNNTESAKSKNYLLPFPFLGDPTSSTNESHGTRVMGIIGAEEFNGLGSRGVAPKSKLIGYNFIESNQSISKLIDQSEGKFDVYNYSYGYPSCEIFPVSSSYIAQLKNGVNQGSIYITSAGNDYINNLKKCDNKLEDHYFVGNSNFDQTKSYPYLITVGAINSQGQKAFYSTPGSNIWISAPGGELNGVFSTDLEGCEEGKANYYSTNPFDSNFNELNPGCKYSMDKQNHGSSYAVPIISGIVALLLEANPDLNWREIKYILAKTAKQEVTLPKSPEHPLGSIYNLSGHIYEQDLIQNQAGFKFHNWFGFGTVDAQLAIDLAEGFNSSFGDLIEKEISESILNLSIPDNNPLGASTTLNFDEDFFIEAVQITINITHPLIADIGIELTSPSGTKSILKNINSQMIGSNMVDVTFLSNAFYGEHTSGDWTLKIIDGHLGDIGQLLKWKIKFWGTETFI